MFKLELGIKVTDSITGFEGTILARCEYLNGCIQYQLEGKEPTKPGDDIWLDEQRLVRIESRKFGASTHAGGGSRSHPNIRH